MPLLTTKFYFPTARSSLVSRPHLVERLQDGLQGPLTLVSAPAGYGKTTLMSEWRAGVGCDYPTAWLSLDDGDNDSTCFLTYLISALATLKPGFGETPLALLQSSDPPSTRVILTGLINELGGFEKTFALILDDYHVITAHPTHDAITYLLDHLPSQMHLVILTRADPPLPLSRLRARGQLTEIRAADLRFTVEEATAFLNQVMRLALSIDQVGALERRTEGWIVGLQLAALSMQDRQNIQYFISAFTGSHHYIVDYLADEVLNSQPEPVQDFLLRTSILDRLTAPLCDALTNHTNGQIILENLEHANLFVVPLDDERRWYRYHHLFAEVLRDRLGQNYPDEVPELHLRAAVWYEQNQFIESAVEHTFTAKDYLGVVRLFRLYYYQQILPKRSSSIFRWFETFPKDFLRQNPWLCVAYTWWLWGRGNRDAAEIHLHYAHQALAQQIPIGPSTPESPELASLTAEVLAFQGLISSTKGELERATILASQALTIAPETSYTVRSMALLDLYLVHRDRGEFEKAIEACNQAICAAIEGRLNAKIIDAFNNLAVLYIIQGQLNKAEKVYRAGLQYFENERQSDYPDCGIFFIFLAEINYEWNKLDEAERLAIRALELSEQASWWLMLYGRVFLARLQRAKGNWPAVLKLLAEAEALLLQFQGTSFENELTAHLARLQAELGKSNEAGQWVQSVTVDISARFSVKQYILAFILAHTLSALGREEELLILLSQIEPIVIEQKCFYWQIEVLVLQAVAWQRKANPGNALPCLEKALFLAEQEGYVRIFLDEGEPMKILLQQVAKKGVYPEYVRRLLSAASPTDKETSLTQSLIEPLSERELLILRLVAEGMSNGQIADSLIIARGTVKKHINNIFGKMGSQSRTQCVARARELNLL
ncbi:MAG: ATP-dependent transcriptional regulator [Acidobacteria bacterium]|nr:ATP-dependent transcriptional regulator [Acidobacteriota bacterium]